MELEGSGMFMITLHTGFKPLPLLVGYTVSYH